MRCPALLTAGHLIEALAVVTLFGCVCSEIIAQEVASTNETSTVKAEDVTREFSSTASSKVPISEEENEIEFHWSRLFGTHKQEDILKPEETLEGLKVLNETLANEFKVLKSKLDKTKDRLHEVRLLLGHSQITNECDHQLAWRLNIAKDKHDYPNPENNTIVAYLEHHRANLLAKCNLLYETKFKEALDNLRNKESFHRLIRPFQEFTVKHTYEFPRLTFPHNIKGPLLAFMAEQQLGQEPVLDPEMGKTRFDEIFNQTLRSVCCDVSDETGFMGNYTLIYASNAVDKQMNQDFRDLYRMHILCDSITLYPEVTSNVLYEHLVSTAQEAAPSGRLITSH